MPRNAHPAAGGRSHAIARPCRETAAAAWKSAGEYRRHGGAIDAAPSARQAVARASSRAPSYAVSNGRIPGHRNLAIAGSALLHIGERRERIVEALHQHL